MKLVTIRVSNANHAGVVRGDTIVDLAHPLLASRFPSAPSSVESLLSGGTASMDAVRKVLDELESGSLVDQLKEKGALVPWASANTRRCPVASVMALASQDAGANEIGRAHV